MHGAHRHGLGAIAVIPFDWSRLSEAVLGISFLIGLPAHVLDVWKKGRVVIFSPAVILLRGFAESYAGSPPTLRWQGLAISFLS